MSGSTVIGEMAALGSALTWALTSILIKQPVQKMGALSANAIRTWLGATLVLALLVGMGKVGMLLALPAYTLFALAFSMIVGLGVGDTIYFHSMRLIGVSRALPLAGSYPLPTLALAVLWLGEPVSWTQVLGTILIVAAVYLLSLPTGRAEKASSLRGSAKLGVVLALVAGLLWAFSTTLMKSVVGHTDLVVVSAVRLPAAGLVLLAPVLRQGGGLRVRGVGAGTLALVIVSGIVGSGLSSFLYVAAVMYAGAAKATALQAVSPFIAAPLAFVFLKERIAPATLAGTALSVLGAWLVMGL